MKYIHCETQMVECFCAATRKTEHWLCPKCRYSVPAILRERKFVPEKLMADGYEKDGLELYLEELESKSTPEEWARFVADMEEARQEIRAHPERFVGLLVNIEDIVDR